MFNSSASRSFAPALQRTGPIVAAGFGLLLVLLLVPVSGCGGSESAESSQASPPASVAGQPPAVDRMAVARRGLAAGNFEAAQKALQQRLLEAPEDTGALELLGDLAAHQKQTRDAISYYQSVIERSSTPSPQLLDKLAQQWMLAGSPYETLAVLQRANDQHPDIPQIKFDLAGLGAMLGLPDAFMPSLIWLAKRGQSDQDSLILLADPGRVEADQSLCDLALEKNPGDLRPHYSLALLDAAHMKWQQVRDRLQPVVQKHPDFVPAYALYGRALIELGQADQIDQWRLKVPAGVALSSSYWVAAGVWAEQQGSPAEAARAYWEALRHDDAAQVEMLTRLSLTLRQIGRTEEAAIVSTRVQQFTSMRDALDMFLERKSRSQTAALGVAVAMEQLGRIWEAEAWARMAASLPEEPAPSIEEKYLAIRKQLTVDTPWQQAGKTIGNQIDLSDLPKISWTVNSTSSPAALETKSFAMRFADQAADRGLLHTCELAAEAEQQGHWIYQSIGGGAGVIDFDLDGWPDLALSMLDGKPMREDSQTNRIFRNVAGQFRDVTESSGYLDRGFAQGITVGDFNDDGFPDIFDANIGRNRLFRNNGDGTFTEVSAEVGLTGQTWTTSATIADLDGDGNADLFEVAYCGGTRPYTHVCSNSKKAISSCTPLLFDGEQDKVLRGRGDGTFEDASEAWLGKQNPGRGLGLVVGHLDERDGLDVFVANDMSVNQLWSGETEDDSFRLVDLAVIRGVAANGRSLSQASMGIAAGDADGDGDLDLFLTHFSNDHNTFYEQVGPGLWSDRSYPVGLAEPSIKLLGFGTELADFDNNGTLELIVTNGHVSDGDDREIAYKMPAQLFERSAGGQWTEADRGQLGEYFQADHLGRALATLDVNRDGLTDFVITHLDEPVSLLCNETKTSFPSIGLTFQATTGHRDAIGTIVTMNVGVRSVTSQLTAGDGFMCTNQRRIAVGLGGAGQANEIVIQWPSGHRQTIESLEAGKEYLLVEGSQEPYVLFHHQ
ncbi:MAG: FG-GAP-like repeat-containing protein [Pirellulales bacterium]|nr:FG-GAP-like repeat-containing protein [Pirellulales bacterium]